MGARGQKAERQGFLDGQRDRLGMVDARQISIEQNPEEDFRGIGRPAKQGIALIKRRHIPRGDEARQPPGEVRGGQHIRDVNGLMQNGLIVWLNKSSCHRVLYDQR